MNGREVKDPAEPGRDRSWLREALLLLGFLLLLGAGVVTVIVPQLGEQPGGEAGSASPEQTKQPAKTD